LTKTIHGSESCRRCQVIQIGPCTARQCSHRSWSVNSSQTSTVEKMAVIQFNLSWKS